MARDALFDLAVNRALEYAQRTRALDRAEDAAALQRGLELWYLRTRFAYRIPIEEVVACLRSHPGGEAHWQGGPGGGWRPGPAPRP